MSLCWFLGQYNRDWIILWRFSLGLVDFLVIIREFLLLWISKGRSIRQFLSIVLLAPTVLSFYGFLPLEHFQRMFNHLKCRFNMSSEQTCLQPSVNCHLVYCSPLLPSSWSCLPSLSRQQTLRPMLAMLSDDGNLKPKNNLKIFYVLLLWLLAIVLLLSGA